MTTTTLPSPDGHRPSRRSSNGTPPGYPLAGPLYTSPAVFDLDVAAVFARTWLFVATEAEVREPGDFVTVDIGPYSVIVRARRRRGGAGAAQRLPAPRRAHADERVGLGRQHRLRLPPVDLRAPTARCCTPATSRPASTRSCFGLKRGARPRRRRAGLRLPGRRAAGRLRPGGRRRIGPYLLPYQLHRTKVAAQVDLVEEANWKLVMENNRECYHCEGGHPELIRTFFPTYGYAEDKIPARLRPAHERYLRGRADLEQACERATSPLAPRSRSCDDRLSAFRIQREALDGAGESYTLDGSRRVPTAAGRARQPAARPASRCTRSRTRGSTSWPTTR